MALVPGLWHGFSKFCILRLPARSSSIRHLVTDVDSDSLASVPTKKPGKAMNPAMKYYLRKRRDNDRFIANERSEFEMGKKHLANMMGMEAEVMTQEDIDKAIAYLFPSGLHPQAKPKMKPPEEVFPRQKDCEFDEEGRPFHPFFYTEKPIFVQAMYEIVESIESNALLADRMAKLRRKPSEMQLINTPSALSTTRWINLEEYEKIFEERINATQLEELITALDRLLENDYSYKSKDLVYRFRVPKSTYKGNQEIVKPQHDEQGRSYVEFIGQRKNAMAKVRVTSPGTGKVRIVHVDYPDIESDIRYFHGFYERHIVMYPLQFTKMLGLVDLDCHVGKGGCTSQAGAIRYATSMALRCFVDEDTLTNMKVCGLLTQDIRVRERKKPGQKGARAKYTWKKR